jgi:hypothetical protein
MRNHLIFGLALSACSCGLDVFDVTVKGSTTVETGSLLEQLVSLPAFSGFNSFDLAQTSEFQNQGVKREQIDSVKMKSFTLSVKSPAGATLDFIDQVSFFAETSGVAKKRVAHKVIADGQSTVSLDLDAVELEPYVTAASMQITTEVSGKRPPVETTVEAVLVFTVDVDVAGAVGSNAP